jgi:hypothetical protein
MKKSELVARLSNVPMSPCEKNKPHRAHRHWDFEWVYCRGVKKFKR